MRSNASKNIYPIIIKNSIFKHTHQERLKTLKFAIKSTLNKYDIDISKFPKIEIELVGGILSGCKRIDLLDFFNLIDWCEEIIELTKLIGLFNQQKVNTFYDRLINSYLKDETIGYEHIVFRQLGFSLLKNFLGKFVFLSGIEKTEKIVEKIADRIIAGNRLWIDALAIRSDKLETLSDAGQSLLFHFFRLEEYGLDLGNKFFKSLMLYYEVGGILGNPGKYGALISDFDREKIKGDDDLYCVYLHAKINEYMLDFLNKFSKEDVQFWLNEMEKLAWKGHLRATEALISFYEMQYADQQRARPYYRELPLSDVQQYKAFIKLSFLQSGTIDSLSKLISCIRSPEELNKFFQLKNVPSHLDAQDRYTFNALYPFMVEGLNALDKNLLLVLRLPPALQGWVADYCKFITDTHFTAERLSLAKIFSGKYQTGLSFEAAADKSSAAITGKQFVSR